MFRVIITLLRHDTTKYPATTRGTAIAFQVRETLDHLPIGKCKAVDLLHNIVNHRFSQFAFTTIVPCQIQNRLVAFLRAVLIQFFHAFVQFRYEPTF